MKNKAKTEDKNTEDAKELELPEVKDPSIEMFEKVALMGNLTSAVQNKELASLLKALPNGDTIYNLLVKAVHQEIQVIMGKTEGIPKEIGIQTQQLAQQMAHFQNLIGQFLKSPLVNVLGAINSKLSPLGDLQQPQNVIDNLNANDNLNNSERSYAGPGQRAPREPGLGSF